MQVRGVEADLWWVGGGLQVAETVTVGMKLQGVMGCVVSGNGCCDIPKAWCQPALNHRCAD